MDFLRLILFSVFWLNCSFIHLYVKLLDQNTVKYLEIRNLILTDPFNGVQQYCNKNQIKRNRIISCSIKLSFKGKDACAVETSKILLKINWQLKLDCSLDILFAKKNIWEVTQTVKTLYHKNTR